MAETTYNPILSVHSTDCAALGPYRIRGPAPIGTVNGTQFPDMALLITETRRLIDDDPIVHVVDPDDQTLTLMLDHAVTHTLAPGSQITFTSAPETTARSILTARGERNRTVALALAAACALERIAFEDGRTDES
jgi:hypothetical protein